MGISIKRAETEQLARQVAEATGVSLTDAIHNALADTLKALGLESQAQTDRRAEIKAWLRDVDARLRISDKTAAEIDAEMYDDQGLPR